MMHSKTFVCYLIDFSASRIYTTSEQTSNSRLRGGTSRQLKVVKIYGYPHYSLNHACGPKETGTYELSFCGRCFAGSTYVRRVWRSSSARSRSSASPLLFLTQVLLGREDRVECHMLDRASKVYVLSRRQLGKGVSPAMLL